MKKITTLLLLLCLVVAAQAQKKKSKGKDKTPAPPTNYTAPEPMPDTATKFTGLIKYYMTTDDGSSRDSMFVIFGEDKIRITMFIPGYQEKDLFENNFIASFKDSAFIILDKRAGTYTMEKLNARNTDAQFDLIPSKKTGLVMKFLCAETTGQLTTKGDETFDVACLVSKQHSFNAAMDYNFLNIQPVVIGYKIVLGYRTKSSTNENTYIMAYQVIPGNMDSYFDLGQYKRK